MCYRLTFNFIYHAKMLKTLSFYFNLNLNSYFIKYKCNNKCRFIYNFAHTIIHNRETKQTENEHNFEKK